MGVGIFLGSDRSESGCCAQQVVAATMPGSVRDSWMSFRDSLLREVWQSDVLAEQSHNRFSLAPLRDKGGGDLRDVRGDPEARIAQLIKQNASALEFLESQLRLFPDRTRHRSEVVGPSVHVANN